MPYNGTGTYTPIPSPDFPAVPGTTIRSSQYNGQIQDMAAALSLSLTRDGQSTATGDIPMGGHRFTGLGAAQGAGDSLRFEQLSKGADIPSAATLVIPPEGLIFNVTGATAISGLAPSIPGRQVLLRFTGALTLTSSANFLMPGWRNVVTKVGDIGVFVCLDGTAWECWLYPKAASSAWLSKAIGEPFPLRDDLAGVLAPPTTDPGYRYIKLTASDAYNSGVLVSESVSGTSPRVVATAVISMPGSPMNGLTVNLWNTERRSPRAGAAGALQDDALVTHNHSAWTDTQGAHQHSYTRLVRQPSSTMWGTTEQISPVTVSDGSWYTTTSDGGHVHNLTVGMAGSEETRVRNQGVTYYMRVF